MAVLPGIDEVAWDVEVLTFRMKISQVLLLFSGGRMDVPSNGSRGKYSSMKLIRTVSTSTHFNRSIPTKAGTPTELTIAVDSN